jgi:3-methyladenine DNA glycosylase AlkD
LHILLNQHRNGFTKGYNNKIMTNTVKEVLSYFKSLENHANIEGMKRYGIAANKAFGVNIPVIRKLAKELKYNHRLAQELWDTKIHEARILAFLIDDPKDVTIEQMERWVSEINSWDICDGCMSNLFDKTFFAYQKAIEWSKRKEEFVKRSGFVLMATLAVHDKKAENSAFENFFPLIEKEAWDDRNFVKKAINWALRQIGKRNPYLYKQAIRVAERIQKQEYKSAKWIAVDALREFKSEKVYVRRARQD